MKSGTFYGPVAMVALLARLVLTAQINTTSEHFKNTPNVVHPTNANSSPNRNLERSFEENVIIFTNALHEYEIWLQLEHHSPANRQRRDPTYLTPPPEPATTSSTILKTEGSPILRPPVPEMDMRPTNLDSSIMNNNLLLTSEGKYPKPNSDTKVNPLEAKWNKTKEEVLSKNDSKHEQTLRFMKTTFDENKDIEASKKKDATAEKMVLSTHIIYDIKSDEFLSAAEKLKNGTDAGYIHAVKEVYNGQARNFDLLLRFGEAVYDPGQKLKIFKALFYEMRTSDHTNSKMLVQLTEHIKTGILDRATGSTFDAAQALLDTICTLEIIDNLQYNKVLLQQRLEMGNERTIEYAVGKIYHYKGNDFKSVIFLARFVQKLEWKVKLYESLYNEMSSNDRNSMERLLELTQIIKTELLGQATGATAIAAQELLNVVCTDATKQRLQSGNFSLAAQMLNMGNDETYKYAVKKIYDNQVANFDSVLRLGNSAQNVSEKFLIYEALYNEMRSSGHTDFEKLSQLNQSIKKATPDQATDGPGFNTGQSLLDRINHNETIDYLQSRQFASAEAILDTCKDNIYESVVMEMYPQRAENSDLLRSFGDSMLNLTNRVKFFQVLYKTIRIKDPNNTEQASKLSQSIQIGILDKAMAAHSLLSNNTKQEFNSSRSNRTEILNRPTSPHIAAALSLFNQIHYDNMIEVVKSCHITQAVQKLVNCSEEAYGYAVKVIFDQQPDSTFDLLLNFANSTRDVAAKFKSYNALYNAAKNSTYQDCARLLFRLYSSMKIELDTYLKNYLPAKNLFDALNETTFYQAVDLISYGFIENANLSKAQHLSKEISNTEIDLLYRVYNVAIKNIQSNEEITITKILNTSLNQLVERMAVHEAIVNLLGSDFFQLNAEKIEVMSFAWRIKFVLTNSTYQSDVPLFWRSRYEKLKDLFPLVVRNVVFSSRVCIRTIADKKYLFATKDTYEDGRRYAFAAGLAKENITSNHRWTIQLKSHLGKHEVYFQNEKFSNYLFLDRHYTFGPNTIREQLYMVTYLNKEISPDTAWGLETDGEVVYIKGSQVGYLFAGPWRRPESEGHLVVTYIKNDTSTENCKWAIEDCS